MRPLPSILMITGRADPGGGPEHLLQLSRQLVKRYRVFIASPREQPYWDRYHALVAPDHLVEIPHRRFSWRTTRQLCRLVRAAQVDLIHSHGRVAGLYGRLTGAVTRRPSVHTAHGPLTFRTFSAPLFWAGEFALGLCTKRIVAVSASEKKTLQRQLLRPWGITEITNGVVIPTERIPFEVARSDPLRIVHVTRFVPQKNSEMMLAILAEIAKTGLAGRFHVDVLGDGPARAALEDAAAQRGLAHYVTFHGAQPAIQPFLRRAFCLLSTSRWEGLPLAVLEAIACGVPAVVSDTPGNNDVVTCNIGRRFPLGDPAMAARQLIELSESLPLWHSLSAAAADVARRRYSVEAMAAKTAVLYEEILHRGA